jgi:hypothetical protein
VDWKTGWPSQNTSRGPKSENVMLPVGWNPRVRWAVSEIEPPSATSPEASVAMLVPSRLTRTGPPHGVATAVLLGSPE